MASIDILTTDGRGRTRPGQPWQRTTASQLALVRLAATVEDTAGRYALDSIVRNLLDDAAGLIRRASVLPDPTE